MLRVISGALVEIPAPINISAWWNFGSLLGLCLVFQIITGIILSLHFVNCIDFAFSRVVHICQDVNHGWLARTLHANGASFFFICLYLHTGRGVYYSSYYFLHTWSVGVRLLLAVMATAFLGYVLPWGQISFWGATVITNLLSAVPYIGTDLVQWLWGGFAVDGATLTRFFAFHFVLPFIVAALVVVHIVYLHQTGSRNPLGVPSPQDKVKFYPYFITKDIVGFLAMLAPLILISLWEPYILGDPENFNPSNPLSTPLHIQPEWYYLFAYAILRSIPNKLGGVIALALSIFILYILPFRANKNLRSISFYPLNQVLFWRFARVAILLTWIGARPVEAPYVLVGQTLTVLYFAYFILDPLVAGWWDTKFWGVNLRLREG